MTLLSTITRAGAYATALELAAKSDKANRPCPSKAKPTRKGFSLPELLGQWLSRTA